jgi:hypothetical protein
MSAPATPDSLLAMLDQLEPPQLERLARVLRAKLRPAPARREEREHELGVLNAMVDQAGLLKSPRPRIARSSYDDARSEKGPALGHARRALRLLVQGLPSSGRPRRSRWNQGRASSLVEQASERLSRAQLHAPGSH